MELIERWLAESDLGSGFANHVADEAELLGMAANRLNISGHEELREVGRELANVADRLRALFGASV